LFSKRIQMPHHFVAAVAVCVDGILAGVFLGSGLVEQSAKALNGKTWIRYKQAKERVYGRAGPILLLGAILLSILAMVGRGERAPFAVAILSLLGVLAVTGVVHVPLNRAIDTASPEAPPSGWADIRTRWRRWHWLRTALTVVAFVLAIVAFGGISANP
jgi:hypothetical protein